MNKNIREETKLLKLPMETEQKNARESWYAPKSKMVDSISSWVKYSGSLDKQVSIYVCSP